MKAPASPLLVVERLSVAPPSPSGSNAVRLLDDIDLIVRPGEMLCVFGRSGSGKTTLARCVAGLDPRRLNIVSGQVTHYVGDCRIRFSAAPPEASAGQQEAHHRRLDRMMEPLRGRHVHLVAQNSATALDPYAPIGGSLRRIARSPLPDAHLAEALEATGLRNPDAILRRYPFELSGGQCKRVALTAAVLSNAPLVIIDEPTSGLDPGLSGCVVDLLARMRDAGRGLLVISHAVRRFAAVADEVHILDRGRSIHRGLGSRLIQEADALDPRARHLVRADLDHAPFPNSENAP